MGFARVCALVRSGLQHVHVIEHVQDSMPYKDKRRHNAYMRDWKAKQAHNTDTAPSTHATPRKRPAAAASTVRSPATGNTPSTERKWKSLGQEGLPRAGWLVRADWAPKVSLGTPPTLPEGGGTAACRADVAGVLAGPGAERFRAWWRLTNAQEPSLTTVAATHGHASAVALVQRSRRAGTCLAALLAFWWLLDWSVAVEVAQLVLNPDPKWPMVLRCLCTAAPAPDAVDGSSPARGDTATPRPLRHRPPRRGCYARPGESRAQALQELDTLRAWHWYLCNSEPWGKEATADLKRRSSTDLAAFLSTLPGVGVYLVKCVLGTLTVAKTVRFDGGCIGPWAEAALQEFQAGVGRRKKPAGLWPWQGPVWHRHVEMLAREFKVHWIDVQQSLCSYRRQQSKAAVVLASETPPEDTGTLQADSSSGTGGTPSRATTTAAQAAAEPSRAAAEAEATPAAAQGSTTPAAECSGRKPRRRIRGKQKDPNSKLREASGRPPLKSALLKACLVQGRMLVRRRTRALPDVTPAPCLPCLPILDLASASTAAVAVEAEEAFEPSAPKRRRDDCEEASPQAPPRKPGTTADVAPAQGGCGALPDGHEAPPQTPQRRPGTTAGVLPVQGRCEDLPDGEGAPPQTPQRRPGTTATAGVARVQDGREDVPDGEGAPPQTPQRRPGTTAAVARVQDGCDIRPDCEEAPQTPQRRPGPTAGAAGGRDGCEEGSSTCALVLARSSGSGCDQSASTVALIEATGSLHKVALGVWRHLAEHLGPAVASRWRACMEGCWAQVLHRVPPAQRVLPEHLAAVLLLAMKWVSSNALADTVWCHAAATAVAQLKSSFRAKDLRAAESQILQWIDFHTPGRALA